MDSYIRLARQLNMIYQKQVFLFPDSCTDLHTAKGTDSCTDTHTAKGRTAFCI